MSLKPICVKDRRFYRPKKNGTVFIEGMPISGSERPAAGLAQPDQWQPYKVWSGDLWECPDCGHQIIVGVAGEPLAERHYPDMGSWVEKADGLQINDC